MAKGEGTIRVKLEPGNFIGEIDRVQRIHKSFYDSLPLPDVVKSALLNQAIRANGSRTE